MRKWIEWLDIRDKITKTGIEYAASTNIDVSPAKDCDHPEAQWLWKTVGHCKSDKEIIRTLRASNDIRALTYEVEFASRDDDIELSWEDGLRMLFKAADAGHSFAQMRISGYVEDAETQKKYARMAVKQGERRAMSNLAYMMVVAKNHIESGELNHQAAELEDVVGLTRCYARRTEDAAFRLKCVRTLYSKYGYHEVDFYHELEIQWLRFTKNNKQNEEILIEFWKACQWEPKDKDHLVRKRMLGEAIHTWKQKARDAVNTWTLCAKRMRLYKDVHLMISRMIWASYSSFSRTK